MTRHARPQWHEAYDAQMALWRWYRTPRSAQWLAGLYREGISGATPEFRRVMSRMYDGEMGRLIDCDPIYVSGEMCELVDHARHDFEPEPLHDFDLPTPRAFVWFDRGIEIHDRYGNPLRIRAFSYGQEYQATDTSDETHAKIVEALESAEAYDRHGDRITVGESALLVAEGLIEAFGISVTIYADRGHYVDMVTEKARPGKADVTRAQATYETDGVPVVPAHLAPWNFGMTFAGNEVDASGEPTGAQEWWQLLQTTLRLMQQKIRPLGFGRPDRATRRAAERLGFPPETEVVIVRLRTEAQERKDPTGEKANYSHRFIRAGHWRNQWYPSAQVHRQIRIMPTVVGDPSLPLLVRPRRVFQWTR